MDEKKNENPNTQLSQITPLTVHVDWTQKGFIAAELRSGFTRHNFLTEENQEYKFNPRLSGEWLQQSTDYYASVEKNKFDIEKSELMQETVISLEDEMPALEEEILLPEDPTTEEGFEDEMPSLEEDEYIGYSLPVLSQPSQLPLPMLHCEGDNLKMKVQDFILKNTNIKHIMYKLD